MPHVADLLAELIAIPSVNPMGRASDDPACSEARLVAWLMAFFADLGVPAERVAVGADRVNVIARLGRDPARPTVLWDVHLDTVPADGMPAPFTPRIADGRITGRGACDVKGAMAAMLWALQRVVRDGTPLGVNLVFSASSDEEATATGVHALVECWGRARGVSRRRPPRADRGCRPRRPPPRGSASAWTRRSRRCPWTCPRERCPEARYRRCRGRPTVLCRTT